MNYYIEICRFIAAFTIMMHHTDDLGCTKIAPGGWIVVEYFFMLSGYFMTAHFEREEYCFTNPERTAMLYLWRKLCRAFPYVVISILISFAAIVFSGEFDIVTTSNLFMSIPSHIFLLEGFGLCSISLNGGLWYLSAMAVAMPCLIILMFKQRNFFRYIASWLLPLMFYTIIFAFNGNLIHWGKCWQFVYLMRAFAGLMIGALIFYLSRLIKPLNISRGLCQLLTLFEVLLFVGMIMLTYSSKCEVESISMILYFAISLCIAFSGKDVIKPIAPKWFSYLGKISLPLYCLHAPIFRWVRILFTDVRGGMKILIGICSSLIIAVIFSCVSSKITRKQFSYERSSE